MRMNLYREAFAGIADDVVRLEMDLSAACDAAPLDFWTAAATYSRWTGRELKEALLKLPLLRLPVAIACGAFADVERVHRPSISLRHLLPDASLHYIPESRLLWEAEGVEQQRSVAAFLGSFIMRALHRLDTWVESTATQDI